MRRLIAPAALVAVLALAGCGGAPAGAAQYQTVDKLRTAYVDAGGSCSTWSAGDAVGPWAQYGNCGTYGAPDEAVLSIYSNDSDLKSSVDAVKSKRTGTMKQMLVGPNWVIQAADVTKVADKLGGTVVKVG